ncbi:MAG: hypothetical protein M3Z64_00450 [Verrucomicrobiota bacterium]|nr:hypothetical protein [Verrucomicrobiota bacterium]
MILVSIQPFAFKKIVLLVVAILCLSSAACFADSLFMTVHSTPYDRQMSRIQPVLVSSASTKGQVSMTLVNHWMEDLRSIPYGFSQEWKTPAETEAGAPADCKAKAVALYERMQAHGASNVRLVIGKRTATSRSTHAWVEWQTGNEAYVLDPTINWMACRSADVARDAYLPLYAFAGTEKYRAAASSLYAKN